MSEIDTLKKQEKAAVEALNRARLARESAEAKERDERLEPIKQLVVLTHDSLCRWNHTDGCGWGYEARGGVHDWSGWAHARWLRHIDTLLTGSSSQPPISVEAIRDILEALQLLRKKHPDALWILRQRMEPA